MSGGAATPRPAFPMRPIGIVRSPYAEQAQVPKGPGARHDAEGVLEIEPEFEPGLTDIEGFSHLIVLWVFDRADPPSLVATPPTDDRPHGVFSTRSPARPNPIGLSTVRLLGIDGTVLRIADVDMVDGTPLLDLKPYVPRFDDRPGARIGWFEGRLNDLEHARADGRFR